MSKVFGFLKEDKMYSHVAGLLIYIITLHLPSNSYSKTETVIGSGQPGQSIGYGILETGYFQYQSNIDFATIENTSVDTGTVVMRYGLHKKFEASGVFVHQNSESNDNISSWSLGARYQVLSQEKNSVPLVLQSRIGSTELGVLSLSSVASAGGALPYYSFSWTVNLRHARIESTADNFGYSINISKSLNSRWSTFIENYGIKAGGGDVKTFFDTGFAYLINNDLQLDASVGYGNSASEESYFFNIGLSGRFYLNI